jgi:hypothetical protein
MMDGIMDIDETGIVLRIICPDTFTVLVSVFAVIVYVDWDDTLLVVIVKLEELVPEEILVVDGTTTFVLEDDKSIVRPPLVAVKGAIDTVPVVDEPPVILDGILIDVTGGALRIICPDTFTTLVSVFAVIVYVD